MTTESVKVLVVDDAAFMRSTLVKLLRQASDIEVVGEARNGREAVELFSATRPDVVCLDIDMPEMDGITALKHFMATRPTPVVVVSSMTDRDDVPFELFRLGVIDFLPKPSSLVGAVEGQTRLLLYVVRNARRIRVENLSRVALQPAAGAAAPTAQPGHLLVVAGALGSVGALVRLVSLLRDGAGELALVCMVPIHDAIAASFRESLARLFGWSTEWLDASLSLDAGKVCLVKPGSRLVVSAQTIARLDGKSEESLDALFAAAGSAMGNRATIVLLAGNESEGSEGLAAAHAHGAHCFVQDPRTALFSSFRPEVPPGVAVLDLESVAATILEHARPDRAAPGEAR
jgi:two-component system, chemotaxis family, protein-glutamate methylesterase/glutaminase